MLVDLEQEDNDREGVDGVNDNNCREDNEGNACAEQRDSEDNEGDVCTDNRYNEDNEGGTRTRKPPTIMHSTSIITVANRNGFLIETVKERLLISYNYALYLHSTCQSFP